MRRARQIAFGLSVFVGILVLTKLGIKAFSPWSQVTDLWESGNTIKELSGNFHFFRYLVAYPGLYLENIWPGFGFSAYVGLFVAASAMLFRASNLLANSHSPGILAWAIFFSAHAFMNGRGAIGWTAWLLCVYLALRNYDKRGLSGVFNFRTAFIVTSSTFLASVTSGVFLVVLASHFMLLGRAVWTSSIPSPGSVRLKSFLSFAISLVLLVVVLNFAVKYLQSAIEKVIVFFGDASGVIHHGIGQVLSEFDPVVFFSFLMILALTASVFVVLARGRAHPATWRLLFVCLVGGSAGFTALTLIIPVLALFLGAIFKGFAKNPPILPALKSARPNAEMPAQ